MALELSLEAAAPRVAWRGRRRRRHHLGRSSRWLGRTPSRRTFLLFSGVLGRTSHLSSSVRPLLRLAFSSAATTGKLLLQEQLGNHGDGVRMEDVCSGVLK
ncbi:hypothetical protein EJB05_37207, partial [Eragrostis curvula]